MRGLNESHIIQVLGVQAWSAQGLLVVSSESSPVVKHCTRSSLQPLEDSLGCNTEQGIVGVSHPSLSKISEQNVEELTEGEECFLEE